MTGFRRWARQLSAVAAFMSGAVAAQTFPSAPIRMIVPFGAGGSGDQVTRILSEKAGADLGQPFVIDIRSGGSGIIGVQAAKQAKPDGYTLLVMATGHVILPSLQQVPYDWAKDFSPVFGTLPTPLVFAVRGKSSINSMADLVNLAKSTPNGLNYGSGGTGSISHLTGARLTRELKFDATHVSFRGFSPAVQALLGDQVHFICASVVDVLALTKSGDFRLLGVTSEKRNALLPDVPTMKEQGFGDFYAASWLSYVAPTGTPPDVVERLHKAFADAAADPGVQERLTRIGVNVEAKSRGDLEKYFKDENLRWRKVIDEHKIKLEN